MAALTVMGEAALTTWERIWYVIQCIAFGAGYFAKIPAIWDSWVFASSYRFALPHVHSMSFFKFTTIPSAVRFLSRPIASTT